LLKNSTVTASRARPPRIPMVDVQAPISNRWQRAIERCSPLEQSAAVARHGARHNRIGPARLAIEFRATKALFAIALLPLPLPQSAEPEKRGRRDRRGRRQAARHLHLSRQAKAGHPCRTTTASVRQMQTRCWQPSPDACRCSSATRRSFPNSPIGSRTPCGDCVQPFLRRLAPLTSPTSIAEPLQHHSFRTLRIKRRV
jgi:hypothetical protein